MLTLELKGNDHDHVVLNLRNRIATRSRDLAKDVGKLVYTELKAVTGKKFYSLYQLKRMGFPYSRRFPKNFLMDDRIINFQSGKLNQSLRWNYVLGSKVTTVTVWAEAGYTKQLVQGNEHQRPRNFFSLAMHRARAKATLKEKQFLDSIER